MGEIMRMLFGCLALLVAFGGVAMLGWTELNAVTAPIPGLTAAADSASAAADPVDGAAALRRTQDELTRLMQQPAARKDAAE